MKRLTWILVACAAVTVAGCGQKGPLVLPDKNAKVVTRPGRPPATPPAVPPPMAPAQAPQESAPQLPPGPTSQGTTGPATKPPPDKKDDSQSTNPPRPN
jgi:predicted small lipoprotein YifL